MQLYPHQEEARDFLLSKKRCILADAPRVGKSLSTAAATVQHLPALIVCPAIVKSVWQKAIHAIDPDVPILVVNGKAAAAGLTKQPGVTIVNYELLQYLPKKARFETLVLDECFPADALVSTPRGQVKIDSLSCGDIVYTAHGIGTIESVSSKPSNDLYLLEFSDGTSIKCTGNHPIFTEKGWVKAQEMVAGQSAFSVQAVLELWSRVSSVDSLRGERKDDCSLQRSPLEHVAFLLKLLCQEIGKPNALRVGEEVGVINFEGDPAQTFKAWRQWARTHLAAEVAARNAGGWMGLGACNQNEAKPNLQQSVSQPLQGRFGQPRKDAGHRGGWAVAQQQCEEGAGSQEGSIAGLIRLERISRIQSEGDTTVFNLQVSGHPSFFVNGVLVHNCHRIKNPKAMRTKAALTLTKACTRVYALSGTVAPNRPAELWPILHGLGIYRGGWHDYVYRYCKAWNPPWGGLDVSGASNLPELKAMIKPHMLRRKKEDVFKDYKEPQVSLITFDLPVDRRERQFDADALVRNPEALLAFEGLSEIMREAGIKKIGPSAEFIDDLLQSGDPVVVFAHHKDVVHGLCEKLQDHKPVVVVGDTPRAQRDKNIADFQSGKTNLIVGNIFSMSEGVDLSRADIIVFVEATWQTSALEQASSRVENIQKSGIPPLVYILTIRASLDHEVLARILAKQKIINQII